MKLLQIVKPTSFSQLRVWHTVRQICFKSGFKNKLPSAYILLLGVSLLISLPAKFFPSLIICPMFFGAQMCTPIGVVIGIVVSFPGYFIVGNFADLVFYLPWYLSLILILIVNFVVYRWFGIYLDKFKGANTYKKVSLLTIGLFVFLAVSVLVFVL